MSTKTDGPPLDSLYQQLKEGLAVAESKEQEAQAQVDLAKAAYAAAKGEAKKLRTMIELYSGKAAAGSLNKQSVKPLIEQCLSAGPLEDDELRQHLEVALKAKGLPLTGISLVIRALRKDFVASDGKWSLEGTTTNNGVSRTRTADHATTKQGVH